MGSGSEADTTLNTSTADADKAEKKKKKKRKKDDEEAAEAETTVADESIAAEEEGGEKKEKKKKKKKDKDKEWACRFINAPIWMNHSASVISCEIHVNITY